MAQGRSPIAVSYSSSSSSATTPASSLNYVYSQPLHNPPVQPVYQEYFNQYQPQSYQSVASQQAPQQTPQQQQLIQTQYQPATYSYDQQAAYPQYYSSYPQSYSTYPQLYQVPHPPVPQAAAVSAASTATYSEINGPNPLNLLASNQYSYDQYEGYTHLSSQQQQQHAQHQLQPQQHQLLPYAVIPQTSVVTSTDHPDWPTKYRELIRHYQEHILSQIIAQPPTSYLWRDFAVSLAGKHPFLAFAVCAFASLHMDYLNCKVSSTVGAAATRQFEPSELSMNLYNQALAQCGVECNNVNQNNFEAAYFATSLIWLCSYRLTKTVPFYSDGPGKTDIFSLTKGPISILVSMKAYITPSPLAAELNSPTDFDHTIPTKIVDDLLVLSHMLGPDGNADQNPTQLLEIIRNGPVSPPIDDPTQEPSAAPRSQPAAYMSQDTYTMHNLSRSSSQYLRVGSDGSSMDHPGKTSGMYQPPLSSSSSSGLHMNVGSMPNANTPDMDPASSLDTSNLGTTRKSAYIEALTSLRVCIRKTISFNSFMRLHEWPMVVNTQFLNMIRQERNPFALVILAHFFAMLLFQSHPSLFWINDRLLYEIRLISGTTGNISTPPRIPRNWEPLMKWPNMVVAAVEEHQAKGFDSPLGIEMFKEMVQRTL